MWAVSGNYEVLALIITKDKVGRSSFHFPSYLIFIFFVP